MFIHKSCEQKSTLLYKFAITWTLDTWDVDRLWHSEAWHSGFLTSNSMDSAVSRSPLGLRKRYVVDHIVSDGFFVWKVIQWIIKITDAQFSLDDSMNLLMEGLFAGQSCGSITNQNLFISLKVNQSYMAKNCKYILSPFRNMTWATIKDADPDCWCSVSIFRTTLTGNTISLLPVLFL